MGILIKKAVLSSEDEKVKVPICASTIFFDIVKPRPKPPTLFFVLEDLK